MSRHLRIALTIFGTGLIATTAYLFGFFSPERVITIGMINLPSSAVFVLTFAIGSGCLMAAITQKKLAGAVLTLFIAVALLLRIHGITHWFFMILWMIVCLLIFLAVNRPSGRRTLV
jgi:Ca2+/Na+ antiporter